MYRQSACFFSAPRLVRRFARSLRFAIKEMPMAATVKDAQQRATVAASKEARARDGAQAMQEYEAERIAVRDRTARLRALRLAKEAEDTQPTKKQQPARKAAGPA
jgi:hypothetical protein